MDLLFVIGLSLLNGLFSLAELAVVSARRGHLEEKAEAGDPGAAHALYLLHKPTRFLSTVQIGITVIGIVSGAFGQANLTDDCAGWLRQFEWLRPHAQTLGLTIVVSLITFLSLVLGELIPKRIALSNPDGIARALAGPMRWLSTAAAPLVHLLTFTTDLLLRPFGKRFQVRDDVSEAEIRHMIERGAETGVFHAAEQELVERIFHLGDRQVRELMVPRPDVIWLDVRAKVDRIREVVTAADQEHLPVCKGDLDHVVGVVHLRDAVKSLLQNEPVNLGKLAESPLFVPEGMPAVKLLETLRRTRQSCAFVVDEFGGTRGMIELEDLLEAILGVMGQPDDDEEPDVVRREDGSWLIAGSSPASELKRLLDVDHIPGEDLSDFATVAGFVLLNLGHLPKVGETFTWERFRLEVVDLDHRRIDKVLLSILPAAPPAAKTADDD